LASFDLAQSGYATPGFREFVMSHDRAMDRTHNLPLEIMVESGLVGLLLFGSGIAVTLDSIIKQSLAQPVPTRTLALGGLMAILAYLLYQMANPSDLGTVVVFWWIIGWTLGVCFYSQSEVTLEPLPVEAHTTGLNTMIFVGQLLLLVTVVGAVYGLWQWRVGIFKP
jgi:hypothetical protein